MPVVDSTGQKFGRLTVIGRAPEDPFDDRESKRNAHWRCRCDCGNEVDVRGTSLRNGTSKSCGCLKVEVRQRAALRATQRRQRREMGDRT